MIGQIKWFIILQLKLELDKKNVLDEQNEKG